MHALREARKPLARVVFPAHGNGSVYARLSAKRVKVASAPRARLNHLPGREPRPELWVVGKVQRAVRVAPHAGVRVGGHRAPARGGRRARRVRLLGSSRRGRAVRGFNLRHWMSANKKKIPLMLETIAKLVNADKLRLDFTEYELSEEFKEALDHAQESGRNTKILVRMSDIGVTY